MNTTYIFWSWQTDSSPKTNRNFIQRCIEKAVKKVGADSAGIIEIDRDTQGLGGTPDIASSILAKIEKADIFIWDATLCYRKPRPAPNPNVLFELGYAFSVLGEGRIIGVMNLETGLNGASLPFDLRNRRWPITYTLPLPWYERLFPALFRSRTEERKKKEGENLVAKLEQAISAALREPKGATNTPNIDYDVAKALWATLDSTFFKAWYDFRMNYPQYEKKEFTSTIDKYLEVVELPENIFQNSQLRSAHEALVQSLESYRAQQAIEMIKQQGDLSVITTKASDAFVEDYDRKYRDQCDRLWALIETSKNNWDSYVALIRKYYPSILRTDTVK